MDLIGLTATQAARLIRDGKLNAIDLTEACLDQIARRDPAVKTFAFSDAEADEEPDRSDCSELCAAGGDCADRLAVGNRDRRPPRRRPDHAGPGASIGGSARLKRNRSERIN
jgi:hypothetical protein